MFKTFFWRFVLLFLVFYTIPANISYGIIDTLPLSLQSVWDTPIIWLGETLFGWEFNTDNLIRGFDSKHELCKNILCILLAIIGSLSWIFIDNRLKRNYKDTLKTFTQTVLRYHLAIILLQYGLSKVVTLQFGIIGINTMETTVGEVTPMDLMYYFLSYSKTITMFSGWLEVIGALLLLFRKTTFLGAIILFGVMANVVLMNISYNFTVTLYAIQILLLILILLSSQLINLYKYVLLGKNATPETYQSLFKDTRFYKTSLVLKVVLLFTVGYLTTTTFKGLIKEYVINTTDWFTSKHTIETFVLNNDTLNLENAENPKLWKEVIFNGYSYYPDSFEITHNDTLQKRFKFKVDSIKHVIEYTPFFEEEEHWKSIHYRKTTAKEYIFEGIYEGDTIYMKTKAKRPEDYRLLKQKGRWLLDLK